MTSRAATVVEMIPIDPIVVLNPRARSRRKFAEIIESVRAVGLKRPIRVTRLPDDEDDCAYGLICGQGRVEAFRELGLSEIPAVVSEATEHDCLVMSLVE